MTKNDERRLALAVPLMRVRIEVERLTLNRDKRPALRPRWRGGELKNAALALAEGLAELLEDGHGDDQGHDSAGASGAGQPGAAAADRAGDGGGAGAEPGAAPLRAGVPADEQSGGSERCCGCGKAKSAGSTLRWTMTEDGPVCRKCERGIRASRGRRGSRAEGRPCGSTM